MKNALIKTIAFLTGASKSLIEFILPVLKDSASNILSAILPIALDVVKSLQDSSKSGAEKRSEAVDKIKSAAVKEGIDASNRVINLAIELALNKLTK